MATMAIQASAMIAPDAIKVEDIATAKNYLYGTRENLLHAVCSLSDAQWKYIPQAGRWCIAEIMEHVVLIELHVHEILDRMGEAALDTRGDLVCGMDEFILQEMPNRKHRLQAPPRECPSGRWTSEETIQEFLEARETSLNILMNCPHLRGRIITHPAFGPWDGYQWIIGAAAHSARHTDQIWDVRNDPGFPQN